MTLTLWHTAIKDHMDEYLMKKSHLILATSSIMVILTACQTTPRQFNGVTGYQIEDQSATSATIAYTLAGRANRDLDENKLQRACQKTFNSTKQYKLTVLSVNEIANPNFAQREKESVQLGQSRASFGFSNTQSYNSSDDFATRQALDAKPSTLHVVRYTCS